MSKGFHSSIILTQELNYDDIYYIPQKSLDILYVRDIIIVIICGQHQNIQFILMLSYK